MTETQDKSFFLLHNEKHTAAQAPTADRKRTAPGPPKSLKDKIVNKHPIPDPTRSEK